MTNAVIVVSLDPKVSSIIVASANPTIAGSTVSWKVNFDKSVTGVDSSDFALVQTGTVTGATITSVTGSGSTWTVTANAGSGAGSLGLNLIDDDSIRTSTGYKLGGNGNGNGNFTGEVYTVSATATTLVDFHMDDASWSGAANEVVDSAVGYHGTAGSLSVTKPTTASATPAISGNPGTCGYGVFNRTNKDFVQLPASFPNLGSTGSAFTITAWIRTSNNALSGQRIFIDDENNSGGYGFSLADGGTGKLRFYSRGTPSSLILDTANVIANNTWFFVAAVVDVPNKTKRIYVFNTSGILLANVGATWSESSFGFDTGNASFGGETNTSGERSNSFGFSGYIDELQVFQGALPQSSLQALLLRTRTCSVVPIVQANPVDFNCVETGQSALTGHINTKLSGTSFTFDVIALKDTNNDGIADTVQTGYASDVNRVVSVELVDGSGSTACSLRSPLSPTVSQTFTFLKTSQPSEQGRKSSAAFTVSKAYQTLRCRVTDATRSPSVVGCSTDSFAVRPTNFTVSSSLNSASFVKTGGSFSVTAASNVVGYNGSPNVNNSKLTAHTGAVQIGILSGTFDYADPATGAAIGVDFGYSEVGYFNLLAQAVYDDVFTELDAINGDCSNDFSNSLVSGKYGCKFGNTVSVSNIGRFIPDHFDVTYNTPVFTPSCNSFTYVGQPVKYATNPVATITAKNNESDITKNYTGSYWKINPAHSTYGIVPSYTEASQSITVLNSNVPVAVDTGNGTGTLRFADTTSNILAVTRGNPLAPFDAEIALNFTLQDTDGVTAINNPMHFGTASAGAGISFTNGHKDMLWGRLVLQNAFGSELVPLQTPLFSEFFDGTNFVKNVEDDVTALNLASQLSLSNPTTSGGAAKAGNAIMNIGSAGSSQASLSSLNLTGGDAGLSFSAPGSGNTGYIDITGIFAGLPWLLFDWDHDGNHNDSPSSRASFGIYEGNTRQIYKREVY